MKSVIEPNNVQRMGVKSEGNFHIKATGKAFRILSDGLYSDKITAVIRELSCNAYDAHVEAGNLETPFRIHLPTQFEPHFALRDFGVGLSHDDVIQVYTTYFESTKTDSNDYIGCLGLGSKSPFSYVDNFSIVSFFNGEKRTYNAFMNEDGIPSIALMSTDATDEHNGIEVSFAVGTQDFRSFYSRIPTVFRYFSLQPEIVGHKDVTIKPVEYSIEGTGWGIRNYADGGARAIMGNVAYPLSDMDSDKVTSEELSLIQSAIDIQFDIGELEVAASRENISFNKATITNVKARLAMLVTEVSKKVSDELNACPTLWDARVLAVELSSGKYSSLKAIFKVGEITYKGQEIEDGLGSTIVSLPKDLRNDLDIEVFAPRRRKRRRSRYSSYSSYDGDPIVAMTKDPEGISVKSDKGFRFYLKDIDRGSHIRCKQIVNESKESDNVIDTVYLLTDISEDGNNDAIQRLMDLLGYEGMVAPISTVERPKRASRASGDYNPMNSKKMLVYQTDTSLHDETVKSSYWVSEKVDVRHGGIYVSIDRYKVHGEIQPDDHISPLMHVLTLIDEDTDFNVIGVKTAMQDKVREDDNWITLKEYVVGKVRDYLADQDLRSDFITAMAYEGMTYNYDSRLSSSIRNQDWSTVDGNSPIHLYLALVDEGQKAANKVKTARGICSRVCIPWMEEGDEDAELQRESKGRAFTVALGSIKETYPMLHMALTSNEYDHAKTLDYIAMIDGANKVSKS